MGLRDSFNDAKEFVSDAIELNDLMLLAPDFKAVLEVDAYFDENFPGFLALDNREVLNNPAKVNVMVVEALGQLNTATQALDNIAASGLQFSKKYMEEYKLKMDKAVTELSRKRLELFDELMRFLPYDTIGARMFKNLYEVGPDIDEEALLDLHANLTKLKTGVFEFSDKFGTIIDPNLDHGRISGGHHTSTPCNNRALSYFLKDKDHKEVFALVYEYIVEEDLSEKSLEENLEAGRKIYKKLQDEEEIDREHDEREADDILLAMENDSGDSGDTGDPMDEAKL